MGGRIQRARERTSQAWQTTKKRAKQATVAGLIFATGMGTVRYGPTVLKFLKTEKGALKAGKALHRVYKKPNMQKELNRREELVNKIKDLQREMGRDLNARTGSRGKENSKKLDQLRAELVLLDARLGAEVIGQIHGKP